MTPNVTPDFRKPGFRPKILYKILKGKSKKIEIFKNELEQNLFLQKCSPSDSKQKTKIHFYPKINSLASNSNFHTQIYRILGRNPDFRKSGDTFGVITFVLGQIF